MLAVRAAAIQEIASGKVRLIKQQPPPGAELYPKVDGAVKSCWPMACLYRSLRFGEEYLPVSALLVDKT